MVAIKRDTRPAFIGSAINKLLSRLGAKASDADLAARWPELVGPDTELVRITRGVKDRTATIRAKNPARRLEISYSAPEIAEKINKYFGYGAIGKVVVR
ncbi:MAG: DUF721 domain-containing protein [Rickettsiales bacterium]|jgi:hypothetical protein|nr:DUF721 domain-containing protein [Rickettsiales bacterium]